MDILQGLPVWIQLAIAFLVAAVLIFMNIGWLIQARSWLQRKGTPPPGGSAGTRATPSGTLPSAPAERDVS
jgi:hypothetical protein